MRPQKLVALAGVFLCGAVQAQTCEPVADWLKLPAERETLGPMHGDIAVSRAGEVYGIETAGMGVQVFSPDGRHLRSLEKAPADLHGFVIRDAGDGEHFYAIPRMPPERWRTGYVVAAHGVATNAEGDIFVAEFSTFGRAHKFDRR